MGSVTIFRQIITKKFVIDTEITLKEWRVFECMPIFKVLLVAGVDSVSIHRSWAVYAIVSFSLLYTVLVKHVGEV